MAEVSAVREEASPVRSVASVRREKREKAGVLGCTLGKLDKSLIILNMDEPGPREAEGLIYNYRNLKWNLSVMWYK